MNNQKIHPITLEEALQHRKEKRAWNGYKVTIPFYGRKNVPAGGNFVMVSYKIPYRFSLNKLTAYFPAGPSGLLEIYLYVDDDNTTTIKGYNPLAVYSPSPFLTGDNGMRESNINGREFEENKYIKIVGVNKGNYPYSIDALVSIMIYPNL